MATILLTGASSFSGLWIAEALAADGHTVVAPLRREADAYAGIPRDRVARLARIAEVTFAAPLASAGFYSIVRARRPDLLAHHAADIPNYRDPDYDPIAGLVRNAADARAIAEALAACGARAIITTGTTFEMGEGGGTAGDLAVTRYGLSQTLTHQAWRHAVRWTGLAHGRFVVAAPFGVYEQGRFVWSLFQSWLGGEPAAVRTPAYVRDNLPAPLLGAAYSRLVADLLAGGPPEQAARPSGIVGPQGDFARIVAREAQALLKRPCEVDDLPQPTLVEPLVRINSDAGLPSDWNGAAFWDAYVDYYLGLQARGLLSSPA